jgi:cephalosporin hydroxylase
MKIIIDTDEKTMTQETGNQKLILDLYSKEAFELISQQWVKIGWSQKYSYTFSWLGRPIIQLPEDLIRAQEVIYRIKPDVIIETGVAHGGSLIYYASLCKVMDKGRVIGIDIKIYSHNRQAIENHGLSSFITLVEGSSTETEIIRQIKSLVHRGETVIVFLDSCHTKQHVLTELEAYHDLITPGSYLVAADGIMKNIYDVPQAEMEWAWNNPLAAAQEFAQKHPEFVLEPPAWVFNESGLTENVTYWPGAWLRRK